MASTSPPSADNQLVQIPRICSTTTKRDKISLKLSKLTNFPNGSTRKGTLEINCDEKNLFTVRVTKMGDETETTWKIRSKSVECIVRKQSETRKTIRMTGSMIQKLGALLDNYFSKPLQKHYLIKVSGKLPVMEMRNKIHISNIEVVLKNAKGSTFGLNRFLSNVDKEDFFWIEFYFEETSNPSFFKQSGLIKVLPSWVEINMPKFDSGVVKLLDVEVLYARFKDGVSSCEQLRELAEYLVLHRNDRCRLEISVAAEYGSDAIQDVCENELWEFIPDAKKLMTIFRYCVKNMIITYHPECETVRMEVVGNEDPRCAIRNKVENVKEINTKICGKSYGDRKEMEKLYIWEPCLPYLLNEMEVDFGKCVIVCENYEMKLADKDETLSKFQSIVSNPKTIVERLKIIGYHEDLTERNMSITVDELTFIHNQVYPSGLFAIFSRLMELYVNSEEILFKNPMLINHAQKLFLLQDGGKVVQLK